MDKKGGELVRILMRRDIMVTSDFTFKQQNYKKGQYEKQSTLVVVKLIGFNGYT